MQKRLLAAYFNHMPDKCMGAAVAYTTLTPLFNHPQAALMSEMMTEDRSPIRSDCIRWTLASAA